MATIFPTTNLLLANLDSADSALLEPLLTRVSLESRETLAEADIPVQNIYFLEDGIASIVNMFEDGFESETGIFGHEGMSGTSVLLGVDQVPTRIYMQLDGTTSLRIGVRDLLQAVAAIPALASILQRYVQVMAVQTSNTAAVNARFDIPHRLARWLLMCHDRVEGNDLNMTHESIAVMLGVRRPGVTVALQTLQSMGLIRGARARTRIVNRAGLEDLANCSYGMAEREYRRLIGPFGKSAPGGGIAKAAHVGGNGSTEHRVSK